MDGTEKIPDKRSVVSDLTLYERGPPGGEASSRHVRAGRADVQ